MIGGKTVVYTSGTFDMLHANHIKMSEYARALGDILIVGVNTDELVESYKSTPIIPFDERIALVKALKYPDIVVPQHSLDHADKVKKLNFDVFVVGVYTFWILISSDILFLFCVLSFYSVDSVL